MQWNPVHAEVLRALVDQDESIRIGDLAERIERDQSPVSAACVELSDEGLLTIAEQAYDEITLGAAGAAVARGTERLPERVIVEVLIQHGGMCPLKDVPNHCSLSAGEVGQTLRWLTARGWGGKSGGDLSVTDAGRAAIGADTPDELLLRALADGQPRRADALRADGIDVEAALPLLDKRKGYVVVKPRVERFVRLTDAGRKRAAEGVEARQGVTQLTPELLTDGAWRQVDIKPYDVTLAAKKLYPGKEHPFQRTLDKTRRVFLEMGFTEIASPWVESSFWDFDALFQPQDHPARDMQDTFYVARPDHCRLPDDALVERVKATHENGGDTGSTGWRYRWSRDLAHRPVLRTHCTAATCRAVARHAAGEPGKYFCIGPVFRRETVDYKHLPVFHQVDGIIIDPKASLSTLLGTLAAFYRKMGFPKVRFRPSFFPYTEPSAEVYLWLEGRQEWVEMGGSGVFRPEVTRPLGIEQRVLAWGLGLERLAMMIHGLKSIGELYFATMPWLREAPLSRA